MKYVNMYIILYDIVTHMTNIYSLNKILYLFIYFNACPAIKQFTGTRKDLFVQFFILFRNNLDTRSDRDE